MTRIGQLFHVAPNGRFEPKKFEFVVVFRKINSDFSQQASFCFPETTTVSEFDFGGEEIGGERSQPVW